MKEIVDGVTSLLGSLILSGALMSGGFFGIQYISNMIKSETIKALKRPQPPLSPFTEKLTRPKHPKEKVFYRE